MVHSLIPDNQRSSGHVVFLTKPEVLEQSSCQELVVVETCIVLDVEILLAVSGLFSIKSAEIGVAYSEDQLSISGTAQLAVFQAGEISAAPGSVLF